MGIDTNLIIGPWPTDDHESWNPARAAAHLDRFGLRVGVVRHSVAIRYDPAEGNQQLRAELAAAADPRLLPAYVLGPLDSGEHGPAADLPARLGNDGVRAVWLYPRSHAWSLRGPEARSLVDALRRAALPVFVELDEVDWNDLDALAEQAPEVDLVVSGVGYRTLRQLVAVLDRWPRIRLDLSYLGPQDGLEILACRYDAGRLLLGTGAPVRDEAAPLYLLDRGDLAPAARHAVADANAAGLLRLPSSVSTVDRDWPAEDVVDAHAHIGAWPVTWVPQQSAAELVAAMDRAGTAQAVFSAMLGLWADPVTGNKEALHAAAAHPNRLFVYLVVDPHRPQDEELLERQLREPAVRGIKVHPHTHECPIDDPRYDWVWRLAVRHRMPVLGHGFAGTDHSDPRQFGVVAGRYPDLTLLIGHSGATVAGFRSTMAAAREHSNLYAETCGSWMTGRWLRRLVDTLGAERVLHGTDANFIDQRYGLGRVLAAPLDAPQRALVLAGNVRRLLGIPALHGGH